MLIKGPIELLPLCLHIFPEDNFIVSRKNVENVIDKDKVGRSRKTNRTAPADCQCV